MAVSKFSFLRNQIVAAQSAVSGAILERALHQPPQLQTNNPELYTALLEELEIAEEDVRTDHEVHLYRHRDVESIDNVKTVIAGGLPAVLPRPHTVSVFNRCRDIAEFRERLAALRLPSFSRNVVLAGAAVRDLYMGHSPPLPHFRAYLVGFDSPETARQAAAELLRGAPAAIGGPAAGSSDSCTLEIILRRFASISDVLRSQLLGAHEFVWDGEDLGMSVMGRLAATYRVGVLDLETRRRGYERSLAADFELGYGLVMPMLDATALAAAGGAMPRLHVGVADVIRRAVFADSMVATGPDEDDRAAESSTDATVPEHTPEPKEKIEEAAWYGAALHTP